MRLMPQHILQALVIWSKNMTSYDFAVNAFNSILGVKGKPFDNQKGVSDNIKGVQ
jgi:hypothetical protein